MSLALLSILPVALLALALPQLLPRFIDAAVIAEIGFLIPVSNRLLELKKEQGAPVPFRERHPFLLLLVGYLCYAEIALGSPSELATQFLAITGATSFAVSKIWLGKGRLWPYRAPATSL